MDNVLNDLINDGLNKTHIMQLIKEKKVGVDKSVLIDKNEIKRVCLTRSSAHYFVNYYLLRNDYRNAAVVMQQYPKKGLSVCKSQALEFLSATNLKQLTYYEKDNPHYKCTAKMKLYFIREIWQYKNKIKELNLSIIL